MKSHRHTTLPRGTCSTCSRNYQVRRDGVIRWHSHAGAKCQGAEQPPEFDLFDDLFDETSP